MALQNTIDSRQLVLCIVTYFSAANLLLLRLLAVMKVKVNLQFLALDHGAQLCAAHYVSFVAVQTLVFIYINGD